MKLAEALQERADINHNIEQLKNRLNNNVLVQDGETTVEDPNKLKTELDNSIKRLQYLIARINGESITEIIAQKDALSLKINIYKETAFLASQLLYRARNSEIKIKSAISVTDWQSEIDKMSKELRLLDNKLQENNWKTELIE